MQYIWQHPDWPHFIYDASKFHDILYQYALETSALSGGLLQLSDDLQIEALVDLMVTEAIKTSSIEGEFINPEEVRSSIINQLGFSSVAQKINDPRAKGIAQLMLTVRKDYQRQLSKEELFHWHHLIMAGSHSIKTSEIGSWRTKAEPMQIISGYYGHEKVHYEAIPSGRVPQEMENFISWFNATDPIHGKIKMAGPIRAAIAHLYFECIHPFMDGNGRVGRALCEKALSQELSRPVLLSLSTGIEQNRKTYYKELSFASSQDMNINGWIGYFVKTIYEAQLDAKDKIGFILKKSKFWNDYASHLNERQSKVIGRMFKEGVGGFKGGMTAQKYMKICNCSKATATRDLSELLKLSCLERLDAGGRSTSYQLKLGLNNFSF